MPTAQKELKVSRLRERLEGAKCLYVTDFTGLDVAMMTELRARLTDASVEYVVVKNTLARRALADGPYAELVEHMTGPNAFAVSREDVVSAAKILTEFARERERPQITAGAIEGQVVSLEEIRRIASLPPRDQLLAEVVGHARAPISGLVFVLHGLMAKFVRTVEAVRAQREAEGGGAPPAASAEAEETVAPATSAEAEETAAPDESPGAEETAAPDESAPDTPEQPDA
ncbi:MAG: 50S ribosomal protein L10 [Gemmatimonadota bacterium]